MYDVKNKNSDMLLNWMMFFYMFLYGRSCLPQSGESGFENCGNEIMLVKVCAVLVFAGTFTELLLVTVPYRRKCQL